MPDIELDISPEKVAWIIVRAREYEAKVQPFNADEETSAEEHNGILEDRHFKSTLREMVGYIRALNDDELANLVALTWIGRGTYETEQWREALNRARDNTAGEQYLLRTPLLAEHLEAGLEAAGFRAAELEDDVSRM
jgi:hypothetical protein